MRQAKRVKIYGLGWVGRAMATLFPQALIHDPALGRYSAETADVAFVCVPTPTVGEGELDTSVVEEVVRTAQEDLIVIRSTLNPGTADRLAAAYHRRIVVQPEYLGETISHPMSDLRTRCFLVIGGQPDDRRRLIELYTTVYNANVNIRQVTALEAEVIKLSENRAIAWKVAQCQELYDACEQAGVDYYTVREAVYGDDPRFDLWWTFIYPEARGMQSKCIPKDVYSWCAWAESAGYQPEITRAILERNKRWIKNGG